VTALRARLAMEDDATVRVELSSALESFVVR
jgi:hypothetical protein